MGIDELEVKNMRRKIAKRIKRELENLGCTVIIKKNPPECWRTTRRRVCYEATVIFKDHELICGAYTDLAALKIAKKCIVAEIIHGFCTKNKLWHDEKEGSK